LSKDDKKIEIPALFGKTRSSAFINRRERMFSHVFITLLPNFPSLSFEKTAGSIVPVRAVETKCKTLLFISL
jgi:hypothetical protein